VSNTVRESSVTLLVDGNPSRSTDDGISRSVTIDGVGVTRIVGTGSTNSGRVQVVSNKIILSGT